MAPLSTGQKRDARELALAMRGMVAELYPDGALGFRPARDHEDPLTSAQRRQLARYHVQGLSDRSIAEVMRSW